MRRCRRDRHGSILANRPSTTGWTVLAESSRNLAAPELTSADPKSCELADISPSSAETRQVLRRRNPANVRATSNRNTMDRSTDLCTTDDQLTYSAGGTEQGQRVIGDDGADTRIKRGGRVWLDLRSTTATPPRPLRFGGRTLVSRLTKQPVRSSGFRMFHRTSADLPGRPGQPCPVQGGGGGN